MASNYNHCPEVKICNGEIFTGWDRILKMLFIKCSFSRSKKVILVVETYQGVHDAELMEKLKNLKPDLFLYTVDFFKDEYEIRKLPYITDDIFGNTTRLQMKDLVDHKKISRARDQIENMDARLIVIYGHGASLINNRIDVLVWADMPKQEIRLRMKRNEVHDERIDFFLDTTKAGNPKMMPASDLTSITRYSLETEF